MSILLSLFPALLFVSKVHSYALPNPQAAAVTAGTPDATTTADLAEITDFSTLPESYYAAFTSDLLNYTVGSAQLASESAAYASWTKEFYATVAPSELAAISSYNRAESSAYAAWTSDLYETIGTSEYNALTSEYAQWTSEQAVYATYNGTGTPSGLGLPAATNVSQAVPAQVTTDGVVVDTGATGSAAAPVVAQQTFAPLTRTQSNPSAYALTCLDSSSSTLSDHTTHYPDCTQTMESICASLTDPTTFVPNQWVWSNKGGRCAMGYWVPAISTSTAAIPSAQECQSNIYKMMVRTCIPVLRDEGMWNAASVNIAVAPSAESAGQQVDSGKVSYMMAGSPYPCGPLGCKMTSDSRAAA